MKPRLADVVFRADASVAAGLGHVKRCLSLAHALRRRGAVCEFLMRESDVPTVALVVAEGFDARPLRARGGAPGPGGDGAPALAHASWLSGSQHEDAAATVEALRAAPPRWLVVDHYALDARWHRPVANALRCRLAAIDDLADRELAVDVLIDHNHALDHRVKYAAWLPPSATLLGGPRYALLGGGYADATPHCVGDRVESIGIFMGGTDADGFAIAALRACLDAGFEGRVEIAATTACPHLPRLQRLAAERLATTVSVDLPELSGFFGRHGLQIGAGGGATWERCCLGAPTIAVAVAANQRQVLAPLAELGVLWFVDDDTPLPTRLATAIRRLLSSPAQRRGLSQRARQLVDGHGADRVAERLQFSPRTDA